MSFKDIIDQDLLSDVTDETERKVLTVMRDRLGPLMDDRIGELVETGVNARLADHGLAARKIRPIDRKYRNMRAAWKNGGFTPERPDIQVTVQDMLDADKQRGADFKAGKLKQKDFIVRDNAFFHDNPFLMPRVIASVVREPVEPTFVLTPLLKTIRWDAPTKSVEFPAVSAMHAGNLEMGETDRYPEGMIEFGSTVTATIGRVGIKVRFTRDMIAFNQFDIMGMHLRAANVALGRWKEQKSANHISGSGTVQFDNGSADPALWTSGRDVNMFFNGTLALQDLHDTYAAMLNDGFIPDLLVMNPLAWTIFAQDPTMRNWAYAQAAGQGIWQRVRGEVAQMRQWAADPLNNSTHVADPEQIQTTYADVPELFPYPLRILVSPFVPYNPTNNTTEVWMMDSNEVGIMAINQAIQTHEWEDPERDIKQVGLDERYAINVLNEGRGIRKFVKVVVTRSYDLDDKISLQLTGPVPTGKTFSL